MGRNNWKKLLTPRAVRAVLARREKIKALRKQIEVLLKPAREHRIKLYEKDRAAYAAEWAELLTDVPAARRATASVRRVLGKKAASRQRLLKRLATLKLKITTQEKAKRRRTR